MGSRELSASALMVVVLPAAALLAQARSPKAQPVETAPEDAASVATDEPVRPLPNELSGTGLYADPSTRTIAPGNRAFTPQYPLWTDGAQKRRWIHLPPGSTIDATEPDAWQFPVGTRLWKEFAFGGRPVETRFIERTKDGWRFASYVWSDDGREATLAPARGVTAAAEVSAGVRHQIPGQSDCRVCHANGKTPVLGFSALQLSIDRDPNAVHREQPEDGALDLGALRRGGRLRGYTGPAAPVVAARTPTERAAIGYLHGNCGHCHRHDGALASIGMVLASPIAPSAPSGVLPEHGTGDVLQTTVARPSRVAPERMRIAPAAADRSVVVERMRSRAPTTQMPPLGTQLVDEDAVKLLTAWIDELPE